MKGRHTLASAPLNEFLELMERPGLTFYKFQRGTCSGYRFDTKLLWGLGVIADDAVEDGSFGLKLILTPCHIGSEQLRYTAYVVHPRAFVSPRRTLQIALRQHGGLLKVLRPEGGSAGARTKSGLKLLRPNGNGIDLRL